MSESESQSPAATLPAVGEGPRGRLAEPLSSEAVWLALACLVGLVRFWRLAEWSLWYDEALTLADARHGALGYNALGYLVIGWTVDALGGIADELSLRLAPALAGWIAIPLTWWAFRPAAGGRRAALAALLVALSSWQIYWSQNARAYTLAQVAGLIGGGLVLRGILRGSPPRALLGGAIVALGVGFHLQCAALLAALTVAPWVAMLLGSRLELPGRRAARRLVALVIAAGLAGSPWIASALGEYLSKKQEFGTIDQLAHFVKSTVYFVTPFAAIAAAIGALDAWRSRDRAGLLCALVAVLGVGSVAAVAVLAQVTAQYAFVFLPWIALLAAWPVERLARPGPRLAWVLLLAVPALANTGLYFTARMGERSRWREAYAYVWNEHREGDLVLGMQAGLADFYLDPGATDLRNPRIVGWADRYSVANWEAWARHERPMWLVIRPDFFGKWTGGFGGDREAFRAFLREDCHLMARFDVPMEGRDLDLEVYYRP